MKKYKLSLEDRKLFGVCGGFGEYFGVDSTLVRIFFVFLFFTLVPIAALYLAIAILAPCE